MDTLSVVLEIEVNILRYTPSIMKHCKVSCLVFVNDLLVVGATNIPTTFSLHYAFRSLNFYIGFEVNCDKYTMYGESDIKFFKFLNNFLVLKI